MNEYIKYRIWLSNFKNESLKLFVIFYCDPTSTIKFISLLMLILTVIVANVFFVSFLLPNSVIGLLIANLIGLIITLSFLKVYEMNYIKNKTLLSDKKIEINI